MVEPSAAEGLEGSFFASITEGAVAQPEINAANKGNKQRDIMGIAR